MKLTIATPELETLMKRVFPRMPPKNDPLTITAVGGKLILQSKNAGSACSAKVTAQGEVKLPAKTFRQVLDTFAGAPELNIEASSAGLCLNLFKMPVSSFNPAPAVPSELADDSGLPA